MGNESAKYLPLTSLLPSDDSEACEQGSSYGDGHSKNHTRHILATREKMLIIIIVLQIIALIVAVIFGKDCGSSAIPCRCPSTDGMLLYSPAQSEIEYEIKSFTPGREHKTIYQGASKEVDHAWGELYNHTLLKIPKSEAALLPNKTYPIKHEPGYYLAGLDVFHQLHCLNNIRRALHRDYYANDTDLDEEHVSHCVDSIRQSLMCSADISVNVWQWSDSYKAVVGYSTQAHTCRNFVKIRDWAREHRIHEWIDPLEYVEDNLPIPAIIS